MKARGFTLVELMIVIAIIAVIAAIAVPNLLASRKAGNETAAIGALKTIQTTQSIFREGDKEKDGNLDYGMLTELTRTQLIQGFGANAPGGQGRKQGYQFAVSYSFTSSNFLWFATAKPMIVGTSGDRYFATNHSGVIFYTTGAEIPMDTNTCSLPNNGVIPTGK